MTKVYQAVGNGKARIDTVKTLLSDYPEAIAGMWKTAFHPYRIEPQHYREFDRIDDEKEKNGIGVPIDDPDVLYDEVNEFGKRVLVDEPTEFGTQNLTVRTGMRTYRVEINTDVIRWEL